MSVSRRRGPSILESFNFAFEGVIHVLRTQRNMRIHFAIAAAVLIAAVAVGVGRLELVALLITISFVLIAEMINSALEAGIDVATTSFDAPAELTLIALVLTIILVVGTKAYTGRGTPLRGGLPSGHAAVAFGGWMAITNIVGDNEHWFLISTVTFIMAVLVAQTRVESGIHSLLEVTYGGILGAL